MLCTMPDVLPGHHHHQAVYDARSPPGLNGFDSKIEGEEAASPSLRQYCIRGRTSADRECLSEYALRRWHEGRRMPLLDSDGIVA